MVSNNEYSKGSLTCGTQKVELQTDNDQRCKNCIAVRPGEIDDSSDLLRLQRFQIGGAAARGIKQNVDFRENTNVQNDCN